MKTTIHRFTAAEELRLWWELKGELQSDLITYYAICSVVGYLQGWYLGSLIVRVWG